MRKIYIFLMCMVCALNAFSQNRKVEGKVTEQGTENPLIGVSVLVKGALSGVSTDANGHYIIQIPIKEKNAILVFSYVGYNRKEVMVGERKVLNVTLTQNENDLDDVVVIGYGTAKKKDLTGSVATVDMKDLTKAPVRSIDEALAGRVAGVQVISSDGQPGAESKIMIRGANSVTQSNSPLYVVDGFPVEGFDLNTISPDEVESISVLKDASSTAIYGARAANGVIVIETKKGKAGEPVVSFNTNHTFAKFTKNMKSMSPLDFVLYQLEYNPSRSPTSPYQGYVAGKKVGVNENGQPIYLNDDNYVDYYANMPASDWLGNMTRVAYQQNYDLAIRGGVGRTTYSLSGNLNKQNGVIINTGFDRYQGRMVLDHKVNDKVKVGVNASYASTLRYGQNFNSGTGNGGGSYIMYSAWCIFRIT